MNKRMQEMCKCFIEQELNSEMWGIDLYEYCWMLSILREENVKEVFKEMRKDKKAMKQVKIMLYKGKEKEE